MNTLNLAYLHFVEGATATFREVSEGVDMDTLSAQFNGPFIGNNNYDLEMAVERRAQGKINAVIATASKYVEGLRIGSVATIEEAFHKDTVMHGFTNGQLLGGPISNLYTFVETNGTAPDITTRLDILAITPTTAVVRIDMEKDAIGADYNDYLTLIKIDGTWKVIAKVYHPFES